MRGLFPVVYTLNEKKETININLPTFNKKIECKGKRIEDVLGGVRTIIDGIVTEKLMSGEKIPNPLESFEEILENQKPDERCIYIDGIIPDDFSISVRETLFEEAQKWRRILNSVSEREQKGYIRNTTTTIGYIIDKADLSREYKKWVEAKDR